MTTSPITRKHQAICAHNGHAFFSQAVFPVRAVRLLAHSYVSDADNRTARPFQIALRFPPLDGSSVAGPEGRYPSHSILPGLFSCSVSTGQYARRKKSNRFPIVGKKIPILIADLFNHLTRSFPSLVAVKSNHAGKDLGVVPEKRGEVTNHDRAKFRVENDARTYRAARERGRQIEPYSSRSPKTQMEIQPRVFSLVR